MGQNAAKQPITAAIWYGLAESFTASSFCGFGCTYILGTWLHPTNMQFVPLVDIKQLHDEVQNPYTHSRNEGIKAEAEELSCSMVTQGFVVELQDPSVLQFLMSCR